MVMALQLHTYILLPGVLWPYKKRPQNPWHKTTHVLALSTASLGSVPLLGPVQWLRGLKLRCLLALFPFWRLGGIIHFQGYRPVFPLCGQRVKGLRTSFLADWLLRTTLRSKMPPTLIATSPTILKPLMEDLPYMESLSLWSCLGADLIRTAPPKVSSHSESRLVTQRTGNLTTEVTSHHSHSAGLYRVCTPGVGSLGPSSGSA